MVTLEFLENKVLIGRTLNPGHQILSLLSTLQNRYLVIP